MTVSEAAQPYRFIAIVPNVLSGLRLGLALTFPLIEPRWWLTAIAAAALSDLADGLIARHFGVTSWVGGLLDAIADKAMTLSVLLTFMWAGVFTGWQVLPLLARDITVGLIALYAVCLREWGAFRMMPSRMLGKLTTVAIIVTFLIALMTQHAWSPAQRVAYFLAMVLSGAAAADYLGQFLMAHRAWKAQRGASPAAER